jgi:hypothetical protein
MGQNNPYPTTNDPSSDADRANPDLTPDPSKAVDPVPDRPNDPTPAQVTAHEKDERDASRDVVEREQVPDAQSRF